jgi:hypothetical protein
MPSQLITPRLRIAACLLLLCLTATAQPGDPNQGRRPERTVPLSGIGWLIAAGSLVGSLALRRSNRKQSHIGILILASFAGNETLAQERISVSDGNWESPSTWLNGIVPTATNSTSVLVRHTVTLPSGSSVTIDNLVIDGGHLVVSANATLQIVDGDSTDMRLSEGGTIDVWGTVIGEDGISLAGMSAANTAFHEGSVYVHRARGEGSIPVAQWHPQSRFEIIGISGNVSMTADAWRQSWGTVVYHASAQGPFVEFRGLLQTIQGDFVVTSTNNSVLRLSQGQNMNLTVGGDLIISGPSEVWFSQSGTCTVDVAGNFVFASTSGASSYFTTTGAASVTVGENLVVDAEHRIRMASTTATGRTELTVKGDVRILRGRIDALGTGSGVVTFGGSNIQYVSIAQDDDAGFEGHIEFRIAEDADVDLGTSLLANTTGGDLVVEGTLRLGSLNENGVIQAGPGGNVQVAGSIVFGAQSRLIYNGSGTQYLSYGSQETQVDILSPRAVLLNDIQFGGLNITSSEFMAGPNTVLVRRNVQGNRSLSFSMLVLNGLGEQVIDMRDATVHDLVVQQSPPGSVVLSQPLSLTGTLAIASPGTQVFSNGNLTLISSSEAPEGTASIGKLTGGSRVVGDVVVQRFIAGAPGDKYRYISSPVENATVADLMDDIPVTGIFEDADRGGDLPEDAPSLFYYSESESEWIPFPTAGTSHENHFDSGRGYCFFNWNGEADSNWDVTGPVHQGTLSLPVTYTVSPDTAMRGWNLVGNPYPSTIRWGQDGWSLSNVSASIAVRDNLLGGFRYWDGEVGSLTDGLLASGQSFWARTTGEDPHLVITEDAKANVGGEYYRRHPPDFVELSLTSGGLTDRAYFRVRDGASTDFDDYDAPKMLNDALSLALRTTDGVPVAISAVPHPECGARVPLDIRGGPGQELTFRVQAHGAFQSASFAILDEMTGTRYDFDAQGELTLNATASQLLFTIDCGSPIIVGTDGSRHADHKRPIVGFPIPSRDTVILSGSGIDEVETIQIHGVDGRNVQHVSVLRRQANDLEVDVTSLAPGTYYITLSGKNLHTRIRILKAY